MSEPVLQTFDLTKIFSARHSLFGRKTSRNVAVDGVSLSIDKGETLGLVGESGCGKTTLGLTILRLIDADSGTIIFDGRDITHLDEKQLRPVRRQIQMIFQDPFAALDPRLTVEQILCEPLEIQGIGTSATRAVIAADLLVKVGLSVEDLGFLPSEFSGGQQQRIGIARALALKPKLIVCDEPVSSLDVSVQAQILNLLRDLQDDLGLSYLFISHNIAVTAFMSRRIGVMYGGKLVEIGTNNQITEAPLHPYTRSLLAAIPDPTPAKRDSETVHFEERTTRSESSTGCVFYRRCPISTAVCSTEPPKLRRIPGKQDVACHLAE